MDLNIRFLSEYPELYMKSRRESAGLYRAGTGSLTVVMIAAVASGIRRASARVERWARGTEKDVPECRLPQARSAR